MGNQTTAVRSLCAATPPRVSRRTATGSPYTGAAVQLAGIGGYSPSLLAWLFVGAVAAGVISAPRDATGGAAPPSLDVPLPWDYDAEAVALYWAQR